MNIEATLNEVVSSGEPAWIILTGKNKFTMWSQINRFLHNKNVHCETINVEDVIRTRLNSSHSIDLFISAVCQPNNLYGITLFLGDTNACSIRDLAKFVKVKCLTMVLE